VYHFGTQHFDFHHQQLTLPTPGDQGTRSPGQGGGGARLRS
jgi:hypothetical protein